MERIKEIFELQDLEEYMCEDPNDAVVPPHTHTTHTTDQSDYIAQLLNHFHDLAHQKDKGHAIADSELIGRIDFLSKRNERLSERIDDLREEVDTLRAENYRLKELLIKNGISY